MRSTTRQARHQGHFYLTPMGQATLLDRFHPEWKEGAPVEGTFLEDLRRLALNRQGGTFRKGPEQRHIAGTRSLNCLYRPLKVMSVSRTQPTLSPNFTFHQ